MWYTGRKKGQEPEVFLDPNKFFSRRYCFPWERWAFSNDGSLAAYSISEGGSDWRKIIVINALSKEGHRGYSERYKNSAVLPGKVMKDSSISSYGPSERKSADSND